MSTQSPVSTTEEDLTQGQIAIITISVLLAFFCVLFVIWCNNLSLYGTSFPWFGSRKRRRYRR